MVCMKEINYNLDLELELTEKLRENYRGSARNGMKYPVDLRR